MIKIIRHPHYPKDSDICDSPQPRVHFDRIILHEVPAIAMNKDEANIESLECARYGEDDDLRNLFVTEGADANFADESGTTAMHRAAANGEVGCMKILKEFGSMHTQNLQGNFPIHWAALNAQEAALKFLFENYDVDVLAKNGAGRSTLSEAFQTQKTEIIEICLSHSSASEENLLKTDADTRVTVDGDYAEKHAVVHEMDFSCSGDKKGKQSENNRRILKVRELPITRADSPFGSDTAPEDDTTGEFSIIY
jgi:ankyrin repeat protein